jgi:hypothetical protein
MSGDDQAICESVEVLEYGIFRCDTKPNLQIAAKSQLQIVLNG